MAPNERVNALAGETSPYLLQHASNPVDWYPWNEEALRRARRENKPILLSIGYSACHWCHVMAHESFEDEDVASVMNQHFLCIKVDREERPDLDKIYQTAHQILTRRPGGWPLTVFLTADDLTPFFAGTYFPKEARFGLPAFAELLLRVAHLHREHRADIGRQNASLVQALERLNPEGVGPDAPLDPAPLRAAVDQLEKDFDEENGGFGAAPKFPQPSSIERLLRYGAGEIETTEERALSMAIRTLRKMALGGIYDQLGGGFFRYSVDEHWMIPHFEKMLYDNAPLLGLYASAWQVTGDRLFERAARETAAWLMREMQSPQGGYYSSLDADSQGEEGLFYLWSRDDVHSALEGEELRVLSRHYGIDRSPNFEDRLWHLHAAVELPQVGEQLGLAANSVQRLLGEGRRKLFAARARRIRPARDEKILTSWNGLAIKGMAIASRVFGEPRLLYSAEQALNFVQSALWTKGRLHAVYKDGRARFPAYLDDYAFLIDGILSLLAARWHEAALNFALELADVMLTQFQDQTRGGFYFTAHDHEKLIHRPKPMMDEALPSGNGIAAQALARLGHLVGETRYLDAAAATIRAGWLGVKQFPQVHNALLTALAEQLYPPHIVMLRGELERLAPWQARCDRYFAPRRLTFALDRDAKMPGALAAHEVRPSPVAYLCQGMQCGAPIADLEELEAQLQKTEFATRSSAASGAGIVPQPVPKGQQPL